MPADVTHEDTLVPPSGVEAASRLSGGRKAQAMITSIQLGRPTQYQVGLLQTGAEMKAEE